MYEQLRPVWSDPTNAGEFGLASSGKYAEVREVACGFD